MTPTLLHALTINNQKYKTTRIGDTWYISCFAGKCLIPVQNISKATGGVADDLKPYLESV